MKSLHKVVKIQEHLIPSRKVCIYAGADESRNPGDPGRTAEMPQTDTTAILETG